MQNQKIELPYFDQLFEDIRQGNTGVIKSFGHHVHWGYWQNPNTADGSIDDFANAAENLTRRVCDAGSAEDGQKILDCGCGFGGTIASLSDRFTNMHLVGLNIDPRQLARAKELVQPQNSNYIEFIEADACQLPFADNSFDLVLAVECIFHFPSRQKFFQEAWRVLKPGGKLALCDFVPQEAFLPIMQFGSYLIQPFLSNFFGYVDSNITLTAYRKLAENTGFISILEEDVTLNTLPTYPFLRRLQSIGENAQTDSSTVIAEWVSRLQLIRYLILSYRKKIN
ncbi:class I SAM-dependent methyltransferase [Fischerella sp. JS2]|uniref:class I SAM-dependent methyltransferase n=1 Tax=Fischerella sp. JS2 TaxID=2597771 RepID=UPI0028EC3F3E|nr:methyltransferase domain-containing protein [Fischerella sp. JS2]